MEILKSKEISCEFVRIPLFEISAKEFLAFAKSDLKDYGNKGLINALSNAKRAISNRMDELIKISFLEKRSSKLNIPKKMEKLNAIGLFVPDLLQRKITSMRNILEHEYIKPKDSQVVKDAIEIAELFLRSTDQYIEFGLLGAIRLRGFRYIIFNIMDNKLEIYNDLREEIIDLSLIDEKNLMVFSKELTNIRTNAAGIEYSHCGDMSWDDFYAQMIKEIHDNPIKINDNTYVSAESSSISAAVKLKISETFIK